MLAQHLCNVGEERRSASKPVRALAFAALLVLAACAKSPQSKAADEVDSNATAVAENVEMGATDMNAIDENAVLNATDMTANASEANESAELANGANRNEATASPQAKTASATSSKIDCPILGARVTSDECDDANALARDVKPGAAALDVPDPMTRGRASQVTLAVDRRSMDKIRQLEARGFNSDEGAAQTPNQVAAGLPGKDYAFPSSVGRFMRASLAGQGFDIKVVSPANPLQEIPSNGQAIWIWEVTPKEAGPHVLTAETEAVAIIGNRTIPLGNGITSKSVTVKVRRMDSVHDFLVAVPDWLKLITAILVAAAALVGAWYGLRKAIRG